VRRSALLAAFVAALLALPAAASAATIDDFTDPGAIPAAGGEVQLVTDLFGVQGGEPFAAAGTCPARARTGWFRIAGNGLPITAATKATTFDTVLAAYDATALGTMLACDGDGPGNQASVTFPTQRGHSYLVQVGGKNDGHGAVRLGFTVTRPANDDRAAAQPVPTGTPVTVDASGATAEAGEVLACGAVPFAGTIWFRYTAAATVDARIAAALGAGVDPGAVVIALYRAGEPLPIACNDGAPGIALGLAPGDYLIQVGARGADGPALAAGPYTLTVADRDRDHDGSLAPADCDDDDPAIHPGAVDVPDDGIDQDCSGADAVDLDRDRDGFTRPADCDDANPAIHPGAVDTPGDRIDQDCAGGDAAFVALRSGISGFFTTTRASTMVTGLSARSLPAGAKVTITCSPRKAGCPFARRTKRVKKAKDRLDLLGKPMRRAHLRAGARLRVAVTRPGFLGVVTTWRIRGKGRNPVRLDQCLAPGARTPRRCPS
jgi:hypothetical protein